MQCILVSVIAATAAADAVKVSSFGYDPADSTRFIQQALDSDAKTVILDRQTGPWTTLPLLARSGKTFIVEPGVELVAKRGEFKGVRDYLFTLDGVTNFTLRGGAGSTFRMWKGDYQKPPYAKSEWRYALRIVRSANVLVEDMRFVESGGDGIVVGGNSRGIAIRRCVCDRNHRQGLSLCSGEDVLVEDCVFSNTSGTAPQAGVDFEPDRPDEKLVNCVLRRCLSIGNAGDGYDVVTHNLRSRSAPVSVTLESCTSVSNRHSVCICTHRSGHDDFPSGLIRMTNCVFRDACVSAVQIRQMPATGPKMLFEDCIVTGCPGPAVAFYGGAWHDDHSDGVTFRNFTVHRPSANGWMKPPNPTFGRPARDIAGDVALVLPDGTRERIALDGAWRASNFREHPGPRPYARCAANPHGRVEVVDLAPGRMVPLAPVFTHVEATYVFHVSRAGEVRFTARTAARRRLPQDARPMAIRKPDGALLVQLPMPGATNTAYSFRAPYPGNYAMRVDGWPAPFTLTASDTPVAFAPTSGDRLLAFPPGEGPAEVSLWIAADRPFSYVNPGTTTDWRLTAKLFGPDGAPAADLGSLHRVNTASFRPARKGLWRVAFHRGAPDAMAVARYDVTGVPGNLFLSPEKCWFEDTVRMTPLAPGAVKLAEGRLGRAVRRSVEAWHKGSVPCHAFAEFFVKGRPQFALGEMWGKFVRSGAMQYRHCRDESLKRILRMAVDDILSAQRSNGSISCVPPERQPDGPGGDLWERKYVMLGMEDYYEWVEPDPAMLDSLRRQMACLAAQVGPPPKADVRTLGWSTNRIESSTLLEPVLRYYRLSADPAALDFAHYLVRSGGALGHDLVQEALDGVPAWRMGGAYPKAYEMLSYFEGLDEYARLTGDRRARTACRRFFANVLTNELTIVGNGGGDRPYHPRVQGEAWDHTAVEQTNPDMTRMMETCVGVTWMKFAGRMLSVTGDVRAADAIENYVMNGLLGAMRPDGGGFSYVNLLNGRKVTDKGWGWRFKSGPVTCCNLNGPMGLAYIPYLAVMEAADGPVLNLYLPLEANVPTPAGNVRLTMETDFPRTGKVRIRVAPDRPGRFAVTVRVPSWCVGVRVSVNGAAVKGGSPGRYLPVMRDWRTDDLLELDFGMACRLIPAPKGSNRAGDAFCALRYGPMVLARDEKADTHFADPVEILARADGMVDVTPLPSAPDNPDRLEFLVPTTKGSIRMCDYASVDCWDGGRVMTWLPLP